MPEASGEAPEESGKARDRAEGESAQSSRRAPGRPEESGKAGAALLELVAVMDRLRRECPWDAKQTHESLAPHLIEETYEALEAIEQHDLAALREELGDVLLQVLFHARVAAERADGTGWTIDDVANGIAAKLVRRHPHVFGDVRVSGADEVKRNWDEIKRAERVERAAQAEGSGPSGSGVSPGDTVSPRIRTVVSALDGVPMGQPALSLAAQLLRRAGAAGAPGELADLPVAGEPGQSAGPGGGSGGSAPSGQHRVASALGAELFAVAARARASGLDPELELRHAARVYRDRVRDWEQQQGG